MNLEELNVRERLIKAGRKEFLRCGYEKASMRCISSIAEVSTGAIYFFFRNKADFFENIVGDTASALKILICEFTKSEIAKTATSAENDRKLIIFLFEHKEETRILLECSKGTAYENFRDEICELLEEAFMAFYHDMGGTKKDESLVKIVVRMRICGYFELMNGDYTME